jgi:hypothetical protein
MHQKFDAPHFRTYQNLALASSLKIGKSMEDRSKVFQTWLLNELQKACNSYISDYEHTVLMMLILKLFLCFKIIYIMLKSKLKNQDD